MNKKDIDIEDYKPKKELNPRLFKKDGQMDSKARLKLLELADDFIDTLEVKWVKPLSIHIVGSSVNYNWNNYSDIDIHISYDFSKIYSKKEFVEDYFMSKRNEWNKLHDGLTVKGFNVEISVTDKKETAVTSGMYDLEKNTWIKEPIDIEEPLDNIPFIKEKCAAYMTKIDNICSKLSDDSLDNKQKENLSKKLENVWNEISSLRKNALKTKKKEMSTGNIIYKIIKHSGYTDKLWNTINKTFNEINSVNENRKVLVISEDQANILCETRY